MIRCLVVFLFGVVLFGGSPRIKNDKTGNPRHKNAAKPSGNRGVRESLRLPDPPLRSDLNCAEGTSACVWVKTAERRPSNSPFRWMAGV